MKYIYVEVWEREIEKPVVYNTYAEANCQMRKDFLAAIRNRAETILSEEKIDLTETSAYGEFEDCEITPYSAWANDCANHDNWDAMIFPFDESKEDKPSLKIEGYIIITYSKNKPEYVEMTSFRGLDHSLTADKAKATVFERIKEAEEVLEYLNNVSNKCFTIDPVKVN